MKDIISPKTGILQLLSKRQGEFISNDQEFKIISNYEELMTIFGEVNEDPNENIFKFIDSYKTVIHSSILYDADEIINIDDFKLINTFEEFYYLDRLIMDNEEIANYNYNFEFVKKIENIILKIVNLKKESRLQKIANSKILLDIVNNYCGLENYDEEINGKDIEIIKDKIDEIIKNNIDIFKELNLDINEENIKSIKNDTIYCDIIISLIKHKRFGDYDYLNNLINDMELEHINIGTIILEPLKDTLDKKNDFMKEYLIQGKEDLNNEAKINFYYILFKYVLKSSIFIYQIPFLIKTRNIVLNMIKLNKISYNNLDNEILERLKYVLETFADSEYYFQNNDETKEELKKLKEVLNYYQFYFFESKIKEVAIIKEQIKKKNIKSEYLKDYEIAVQANNFYPIIKNLYYTSNNKEIDSEKNLKENFKNFEIIYKMIKDHKFKKLKKKEIIYKLMTDENSKDIFSKIFTKDDIDSFIKHMKEIEKKEKKVRKEEEQTEEDAAPIFNNNINNKIMENSIIIPEKPGLKKTPEEKSNDSKNNESNFSMSDQPTKISSFVKSKEKNKSYSGFIDKPTLDDNSSINNENNLNLAINILNKCSIDFSVHKNDNQNLIKMDHASIGDNNLNITVDKLEKFMNISMKFNDTDDEILENCYRLSKFIEEFKQRIIKEFINDYELQLKLELTKNSETYNDGIYDIDALYIFYEPWTNKEFSYREENVLIYGTESNLQGFNFMVYDINQEKYRNPMYKEIDKYVKDIKKLEFSNNSSSTSSNSLKESPYIYKRARDISVLEIVKIIENKSSFNSFIKELINGFFVYMKNDNTLQLLNEKYNPIIEIKDYRDKILSICDIFQDSGRNIEKKKKGGELKIVLVSNRSLFLTTVDLDKLDTYTKELDVSHIYCFKSIEMKKNNYILVGKKCTSYFTDLFLSKEPRENRLFEEKSFFNSIKINENVFALVSNKIFPNGEDELMFYNLKKKKLLQNEIKGYSFTMSQNGIELIPKLEAETKTNRILLCACKRYTKDQSNGILLVNPQLGDNKEIEEPFYNTGNFEVNCFCHLFNVKEKIVKKPLVPLVDEEEIIIYPEQDPENLIFEETNYFLVGGFDGDKREGKIRLYKIIYGEKSYNTKIKYVQDILFEKKKGIEDFNGAINCLIQSKTTGNILANCYNGNIYLLTPPNLNYYLEQDKNKY